MGKAHPRYSVSQVKHHYSFLLDLVSLHRQTAEGDSISPLYGVRNSNQWVFREARSHTLSTWEFDPEQPVTTDGISHSLTVSGPDVSSGQGP